MHRRLAKRLFLPLVSLFGVEFSRAFALFLLIAFCAVCQPAAYAALNGDVPSRSEIQSQLDALNKQKTLTPVNKLTQQDLTRTLELLDAIDRTRQDGAQLKQQLQLAPGKLRQVTDDPVSYTHLTLPTIYSV